MKSALAAGLSALLTLILAVPAMAHDNGEGLIGETDDRVVTFFSLGVVVFFILVVCVGSWLQSVLEKRKEARKAAELQQRIGW
jgi:nitrogen fixation/metabolism regulation signal transduction histidine kinase